ncbi:MAG: ChbG/HpnK family deacetylase [Anaerorhabdus sp.]|uniref:ChbG/HpnK family deacetylase n=1 Tax=Anaerorhabdus sp. TaxID=1872524 RepID=UPI002FCB1800
MTVIIDKHADDFGLTTATSNVIFDLCQDNKLDSISLMVNMSCFDEALDKLRIISKSKNISIHLNLLEGKAVSNKKDIQWLVDGDSKFKRSWFDFFILNFSPNRNAIKKEIKHELKNQLLKGINALDTKNIRIDSHQHLHMIPIVFKALVEVVNENELKLSYIRVSKEPILPYLKQPKLYKTYSVVNIVKNLILNLFSFYVEKHCNQLNLEKMYIWGLIMSGKMDYERIEILKNEFYKYSLKKERKIEMIFHPGSSQNNELETELNEEDRGFYLSKNRDIERETLYKL